MKRSGTNSITADLTNYNTENYKELRTYKVTGFPLIFVTNRADLYTTIRYHRLFALLRVYPCCDRLT